ncbi:Protein FAM13A [Tupaia chinensis]|uniref:Protein FAM13A n=1 Tax=Tupaia chinensis TaxID=246437 RepID=L9L553_TUPCH|nr:Protein FAM13A [Tupaia chinensis]
MGSGPGTSAPGLRLQVTVLVTLDTYPLRNVSHFQNLSFVLNGILGLFHFCNPPFLRKLTDGGVPSGLEGMKEQDICNRIMAKILENYNTLFEVECTENDNQRCENVARLILVKEASSKSSLPIFLTRGLERDMPKSSPKGKIPKSRSEGSIQTHRIPQPELSDGVPQLSLRRSRRKPCLDDVSSAEDASGAKVASRSGSEDVPWVMSPVSSNHCSVNKHQQALNVGLEESFKLPELGKPTEEQELEQEEEQLRGEEEDEEEGRRRRRRSSSSSSASSNATAAPLIGQLVQLPPWNKSAHVSQVSSVSTTGELLERTIRSAVEQHLFDVSSSGGQSSEDSESGTSSASSTTSARQRRRQSKQQDEVRRGRDKGLINKENIPSGFNSLEDCILNTQEVEKLHENTSDYIGERSKPKRQKSSMKLSELNENKDGLVNLTMKIQEHPSLPDTKQPRNQDADGQQESFVSEVPQLDLTALCDEKTWEEPIPASSSWQRENVDSDEARLSPQAGRLIRQLLDEDSDPMLSPRFYAYGQSRQYLDDTEVPPSPPNSHSFMRRRSSSLGSYDDEQEDLTPAQLTRRIQSLKKKIRKFEDRFEEERKYRPSHSDKAANPEVLKWTNDLAKFRKQLKESKLKISEEDLTPRMRQRSNTLPKSFGSQLEKEDEKKQELVDKAIKPSVEATLESIQRKLQEKRAESSRPEDIKDMTKDQIANEKVALQKALLHYESIHGRPVTKSERQVMKPLYDRYRLVKQILSRVNTIPIIGSPSSKRRSPLLQPIIEGETASFFKEIKEEEEGSEDDSNTKPDFTVTLKTDFSARCFLDQFEDDADEFISPMDDKVPSKCSQDTGLSNLHAASIPELLEHLQEMREEKKRIRKKLRDFEDNFFRLNGRNVQKEDRTPMAEEYNEYKHIKAKLRLLEVLISKRDTDSKSM